MADSEPAKDKVDASEPPKTEEAPKPVDLPKEESLPEPPKEDRPLMTGSIEWTASEYVENHKNAGWFIAVGFSAVLLAGVLYFITRDLISIAIVSIAVILFAIAGAKKPRTLKYLLDDNGITIADKLFPFSTFKSFAVINEGGINSIQLLPLKRFQMALSIYYPPPQEEMILKVLGSHLPAEDRKHDLIDRLMRRLNF